MRRKLVTVFGCLIVMSAFIGGVMSFSPGVGSPVSLSEAGMMMGGTCHIESSPQVTECGAGIEGGGATILEWTQTQSSSGDSDTIKHRSTTGWCRYIELSGNACGE